MQSRAARSEVYDNPEQHRFELATPLGVAYSEYSLAGGLLTIKHTEVPAELEGQGIGSRLARGVLEAARARGFKVMARCPFVAAYMERHPEFDDLRL
jgi:predicted GNAT family acetyltransferase